MRRIICSIIVAVAFNTACSPTGTFKVTAMPADRTLQEQVVDRHPGWVSDRIAIVDVSGVLMNSRDSGMFSEGENPVSLTVEKLSAAADDGRVKAVVLRINSPGGTVTASDTLYEEILAFKKKTKKPVVAYFQDVAASGAYYLSCASDEIIAQRTSVTGSIGVLMQMVNFTQTMVKVGISADAITSGPLKDAGSPLREMRPEERAIFQGLVDSFYQQFLKVVANGRPKLSRDQITKLADGRVYSADQALELGLIDRIATLKEAVEDAEKLAGIKAAHVVIYHRPLGWAPNVYADTPVPTPRAINLFNINLSGVLTKQPTFMYIWSAEG